MCVCIPGQVTAITDAANRLALVNVGGATRQVSLACIVDATHSVESCVGDWVLIHVGFAMSRIDEAEARKTLELFAALGDIEPAMAAQLAGLQGNEGPLPSFLDPLGGQVAARRRPWGRNQP